MSITRAYPPMLQEDQHSTFERPHETDMHSIMRSFHTMCVSTSQPCDSIDRLANLPLELYDSIIDHLDVPAILAFRQVNKAHNAATRTTFDRILARALFASLSRPDHQKGAEYVARAIDNLRPYFEKSPEWTEAPIWGNADHWTFHVVDVRDGKPVINGPFEDWLRLLVEVDEINLCQLERKIRIAEILKTDSLWQGDDAEQSVYPMITSGPHDLTEQFQRPRGFLAGMVRSGLTARTFHLHDMSPLVFKIGNDHMSGGASFDNHQLRFFLRHTLRICLDLRWNTWDATTPPGIRKHARPDAVANFISSAPLLQDLELEIGGHYKGASNVPLPSWTFEADMVAELGRLLEGLHGLNALKRCTFVGEGEKSMIEFEPGDICKFLAANRQLRYFCLSNILLTRFPDASKGLATLADMPVLEEVQLETIYSKLQNGHPATLFTMNVMTDEGDVVEAAPEDCANVVHLTGAANIKRSFARYDDLFEWKDITTWAGYTEDDDHDLPLVPFEDANTTG